MGTVEDYKKTYCDMDFERRGLFEILCQKFPVEKVIYPGCSSHITPSFYFQHVLYIDRSQAAIDFFSDGENIRRLISMNKVYRQSPYFSFSAADFNDIKQSTVYKYDMLVSLYADDVIESCLSFLRAGGIAVSNNFHDEVLHVIKTDTMELIGKIVGKNSTYTYVSDLNLKVNHRDEEKVQKICVRNTAEGIRYFDNETYYVMKKKANRSI